MFLIVSYEEETEILNTFSYFAKFFGKTDIHDENVALKDQK